MNSKVPAKISYLAFFLAYLTKKKKEVRSRLKENYLIDSDSLVTHQWKGSNMRYSVTYCASLEDFAKMSFPTLMKGLKLLKVLIEALQRNYQPCIMTGEIEWNASSLWERL